MQWCVEQFAGRVPRLMRRYGHSLHIDHHDGPDVWMLEEAMRGRCDFAGLTFVLPANDEPGEVR